MAATIPGALNNILSKIPDLDKSNWHKWSKGMNLFFLGVGAEFIPTGTTPASTDLDKAALDKRMLPYLYGKVAEEYQYLIEDETSAVSAWKELKGQFEKTSMSNRMVARRALYSIEHDPSQDIAVFLHAIKTAVTRLTALGVTIGEQEQKDIILMNLHLSFHTARGVILTTAKEPDLATVKSLLATTDSDPSVKTEPTEISFSAAHRARDTPPSFSSSGSSGSIGAHGFPVDAQGHRWCDPTNTDCHRCGRSGHISAKCMHTMPQFVKDWIMKHSSSSSSSAAFAAALAAGLTPESFAKQYWSHVGGTTPGKYASAKTAYGDTYESAAAAMLAAQKAAGIIPADWGEPYDSSDDDLDDDLEEEETHRTHFGIALHT